MKREITINKLLLNLEYMASLVDKKVCINDCPNCPFEGDCICVDIDNVYDGLVDIKKRIQEAIYND